ncbi:MAG: hypothetical protein Q9166_005957 [cf. Caloplaca sp. 2 TL-2023]
MGVGFALQAQSEDSHKLPRPSRPNYNKLHAQPLPVKAYPLPLFIPHNPLSLFQIAFTYAFHLVTRPSSHPHQLLRGYFSAETRSIHVTDERTARVLWEQGFFGKGSLSRSEPAWLDREKIRQGLVVGETSEEVTRRRREERKQFKNERARKEREAIEEKLAEEATSSSKGTEDSIGNGHVKPPVITKVEQPIGTEDIISQPLAPGLACESPEQDLSPGANQQISFPSSDAASDVSILQVPSKAIINQEHLQLTVEEAFFLVYALGVLEIQDITTSQLIPTTDFFSICRSHSYFPPQTQPKLSPDDPFLLSYVVYHHFRSLGWVIRPGIKFAVDYLLYNRGPVFSHAEFAVIILPSYSDAYWSSTVDLRAAVDRKGKKSWWWLHCVNRVQTQVKKSLVVVYVEVPPPIKVDEGIINEDGDVVDIGRFLKRYRIREMMMKRWTPNREKG